MSNYGGPTDPNGGAHGGGQPPTFGTQATPPPSPASGEPRKGFFAALFDFSFNTFITPMIVKAVYVLAVVGLVLTWLVFLVSGFSKGAGLGVVTLIIGPVVLLIYLAFIRMTLEFYLAIVRMSQDIHQRATI